MSFVYKAIFKNLAASTFGLAVNFLTRIALVPVFISFWGVEKYADWILITAMSSFFAMTDLGLNRASNNEFVIKYQKKDYKTCSSLQVNAFVFIILIYSLFIGLSFIIYSTIGFKDILGVSQFSDYETSVGFVLLITKVFATMYGRVYHGIFRAVAKTHLVILADNIERLLDLLIIVVSLYFGLNLIPMLIMYLASTVGGIVFKYFYSSNIFHAKFSFLNYDKGLFISMAKPSLAFMLFPLGEAISNQGMIFLVNSMLGGVLLVVFTTTRTLINFLRQFVNMITTSVNPEICAAYGRKDFKTITSIYSRFLLIILFSIMAIAIGLFFYGEPVYNFWTKNEIIFDNWFFYGMLMVLIVSSISALLSVIPMATNTHSKFTLMFIICQSLSILLGFIFLKITQELFLVSVALILTELLLLIFLAKRNNTFLNLDFNKLILELNNQSKFLFNKGVVLVYNYNKKQK